MLNNEYPPLGGGAGVCTRFHAEGLALLGHRITIVTAWYKGEKEYSENGNIKIVRLKSLRKTHFKSNPVEMLSWVYHAIKFIKTNVKTNEFDICVANFAIPAGIVSKFAKKKHNLPYIIISHGQDIPFFFPKQMLKYHLVTYFWIKAIIKRSEKLILLSKEMKANADRFVGKKSSDKNIVIPNGCDMKLFKPDFSKKGEKFIILFVGRLVSQKDPITFLKAINVVSKSIVNFEVHIYGDGPMLGTMKSFTKKANLRNIQFKGWVSKAEIIEAYQTASLQIVSSRDEAMSIAVLESLSCGQYIISTPVSGNTELIKNGVNGEFFNFGDYKSLAEKIWIFYHQKHINKINVSIEELNHFRQKYVWNAIVKQYEDVLNNLLIV
jgi:glycosyltransferase involved in cell wall biosynthesis